MPTLCKYRLTGLPLILSPARLFYYLPPLSPLSDQASFIAFSLQVEQDLKTGKIFSSIFGAHHFFSFYHYCPIRAVSSLHRAILSSFPPVFIGQVSFEKRPGVITIIRGLNIKIPLNDISDKLHAVQTCCWKQSDTTILNG